MQSIEYLDRSTAYSTMKMNLESIIQQLDPEELAETHLRMLRHKTRLDDRQLLEFMRGQGYSQALGFFQSSLLEILEGLMSYSVVPESPTLDEQIQTAGLANIKEIIEDLLARTDLLDRFLRHTGELLGEPFDPADRPNPRPSPLLN